MSSLHLLTTATTFSPLKRQPQIQTKPTNNNPPFLRYHPSCTSTPLSLLSFQNHRLLLTLPAAGVAGTSPAAEDAAVALPEGLRPELMPQHVAVIMDGNARWARQRGLPGSVGHEAGIRGLRRMVDMCCKWGISVLTVFGFSSDNWVRPKVITLSFSL